VPNSVNVRGTDNTATERHGAFAPLRHHAFRWLWVAFSASTMGVWMESLGAQWFLVSRPGGAHFVALVQGAVALPMSLLAIPGGVLADNLDRRRLLLVLQAGALLVTTALALLAWRDLVTVWSILALIALVAVTNALTTTPFQSLLPDLVPRSEIPAAAALMGVGVNLARIIGPAVAGLVVAILGVPAVFALGAATAALFIAVLVAWSGEASPVSHHERFFPAVRSGVRYVRYSPQVLRIMLRSFSFATGMMSVFALLPLLSTEVLHQGAVGYGSLFACIGVGAVGGALSVTRLRTRLSANAIVGLCFAVCAPVVAVVSLVTIVPFAALLLMIAGWGWTVCLSTMAASMQLYLPAWVRARGLATYWLALFGGQALGSLLVGAIAATWGLSSAFFTSAGLLALGATFSIWLPVKQLDHIDRTPSVHWPEPQLVVDTDEISGTVVIQTIYWVDQEVEEKFLQRMVGVRRVRLRTGGTGWRLLKDAEMPRRFVEEYSVGSWQEHEYQLHHRLVASDRELEMLAAELSNPEPRMLRLYVLALRTR
jgi:predicted MFS family arabinose efflux permease